MENRTDLVEDLIILDKLGENSFRSRRLAPPHVPLGHTAVYGGQLVAQCLYAASQTVEGEYFVHSLHTYFIHPSFPEKPIHFEVERIRDGKTYKIRLVIAIQNGQRAVMMACSFSRKTKSKYSHQFSMPPVPAPEEIMNDRDRYLTVMKDPRCTGPIYKYLEKALEVTLKHIECRYIVSSPDEGILIPPKKASRRYAWLRVIKPFDDCHQSLHRCALAYASDERILTVAGLPLGIGFGTDPYLSMLTSLDHTMYFHDDFQADEWLLYEIESPRLKDERGLVNSRVYRRDGTLVANVIQEGVVRLASGSLAQMLKQKGRL
ncbi:uncharacterized protein VTP21DRAFT_5423 [Calcarisporiella thermophila]|uniref:uncharacterized protein n=1 Tax=Calcarisporiella thermophila TaxID=911321 RepID=UPI0037421C9C